MVRFVSALALLLAASMDASLVQAATKSIDTGCQGHGNLNYLATHAVDCGPGYAMSDWKVRRCGENDAFHILYDCEPLPKTGTSTEDKKTSCEIGENRNIEYLDRFDVHCDEGQVLQSWQFNTAECPGDEAHIDFKCVNLPPSASLKCEEYKTECDKIYGKPVIYLDRHDVVCPGNKVFNHWEMYQTDCAAQLGQGNVNSQFVFTCCDIEGGGDGGASGDPHINSWSGKTFDFHGGCDLVLLQDPDFANGLGINIHIRTKIKTWWSYIEAAAIQIGKDTLEIQGSAKDGATFWFNRDLKMDLQTESGFIGDFPIQFQRVNDHHTQTRIDLGNGDAIGIESFKDFVRVNVHNKSNKAFGDSYGLMGSFPYGDKVGRDGKTIIEDNDTFGQEWMVLPEEPKLFHSESVVKGDKCMMPDAKARANRRLGEGSITEEDAGLACARVSEKNRDACIFDVMATQDKDMAGSY